MPFLLVRPWLNSLVLAMCGHPYAPSLYHNAGSLSRSYSIGTCEFWHLYINLGGWIHIQIKFSPLHSNGLTLLDIYTWTEIAFSSTLEEKILKLNEIQESYRQNTYISNLLTHYENKYKKSYKNCRALSTGYQIFTTISSDLCFKHNIMKQPRFSWFL